MASREQQRRIRDAFLARVGQGGNGNGSSHHGHHGHHDEFLDLGSTANPRGGQSYPGAAMSPASFGGVGSAEEQTLARRKMLNATLSTPDDRALLDNAADLSSRLAGVVFRTGINVGYDTMTASVLSRGMLGEWDIGNLEHAWRAWDLAILRLYCLGRMVYCGRVEGVKMGAGRHDPVTGYVANLQISCRGAWADLTRKVPTIDQQYTQEDAFVTLSQLAQIIISDLDTDLIARDFSQVQDTAVNIGPISTSFSSYGYDMIMDGLRSGSSQDDEFYFAVLGGSGDRCYPIVAPRIGALVRWQVNLFETGLELSKNLAEYCSDVWASFTDPDGSSRVADIESNDEAAGLHGGIRQQKTISLAKIPVTSARAAQRAFLNARADPVGYEGNAVFTPRYGALYGQARNLEGGLEPAWLVRCGDAVQVVLALPDDPIMGRDDMARTTVVETTEVDWDAGVTTITLDQRSLKSRRSERAEELHRLNMDLAPWKNATSVLHAFDTGSDFNVQTPATVVTTMKGAESDGALHFELQADGEISIYMEGYFKPSNTTTNGPLTLSYEMDYEDRGPPSGSSKQLQAVKDASGFSNGRTVAGFKRRRMSKGKHIIRLWAEAPVSNIFALNTLVLEIWAKPA